MIFVFWHPYLMFHQAAYIRELASVQGNTVYWCVQETLPGYYRDRGYPVPDTGNVHVRVAPSDEQIKQFATLHGSIQVFFGLRGFSLPLQAFRASLGASVRRILMSENRYEPGARLVPRWLAYTWDALRYRRQISGVFCIGYTGRYGGARFFAACGYPRERIVPFLHVVDRTAMPVSRQSPAYKEILYVGQLIQRKRVDLLLTAFSKLDEPTSRLRIIGEGSEEWALKEQAQRLGVSGRVEFSGGMPNVEIVAAMARADVLVLPSRFDGWGAVVNEALMVGTPVICSDRCGASDLIEDGCNGYVFASGSAEALLKCLRAFCKDFSWKREVMASDESARLSGSAAASRFQVQLIELLGNDPAAAMSFPGANGP